MKVLVVVLLSVAAVRAEAEPKSKSDANAYTFGQIYHGLPVHNAYATGHPHNIGVITGVDYGHGHVAGYGAIGNRGYAGYGHHGYAGYGHGYYGKREADSDPKSDAYTIAQIHHGLPVHNAYATGHPHNVGVITGVDYGHGRVSGYGALGNRGYAGYGHLGYAHYGNHGYYGKREADSDPKSDAYTIAQIHHGLPVHNAYITGHPHNVGVITGVDYGYGRVSGYGAIGNRGYAGYGYSGIGHYYG